MRLLTDSRAFQQSFKFNTMFSVRNQGSIDYESDFFLTKKNWTPIYENNLPIVDKQRLLKFKKWKKMFLFVGKSINPLCNNKSNLNYCYLEIYYVKKKKKKKKLNNYW